MTVVNGETGPRASRSSSSSTSAQNSSVETSRPRTIQGTPSLLECVGDGPAARNCGIEQAIADRIALLFSDQRERLRNEGSLAQDAIDGVVEFTLCADFFVCDPA